MVRSPISIFNFSLIWRLLIDSFEFDEAAQACDDHAFRDVRAAGERGAVVLVGLAFAVIPDLTIGAVAIPAEISVRDGLKREKLKAAQQTIVLRHFDAASQNFYRDEFLVRVKQIAINHRGLSAPT